MCHKIKYSAMEYSMVFCTHNISFSTSVYSLGSVSLVITHLASHLGVNTLFGSCLSQPERQQKGARKPMTSRWGCSRAAVLSVGVALLSTRSTAVTYFLGLVRTTQRYTRGVS